MLFSDSRWFQAVFHETNRVLKISNNKWPVKSGGSAKIISGGVKSGGALFFWPRQIGKYGRNWSSYPLEQYEPAEPKITQVV